VRKGTRTAGERELIAWAAKRGWKRGPRNGTSHLRLVHENGKVVPIPSKVEKDSPIWKTTQKKLASADGRGPIQGT
jgi:predicted RNA binding protein YcfA (HicA-like mRNA interferase family)